jgi:hypothetical protein
MGDKKNIFLLIIIIALAIVFWNFYNTEHFDQAGIALTKYGDTKYDLKGNPLNVRNVTNCYYDKRICYDNTFGDTESNTYGGKRLGRHE